MLPLQPSLDVYAGRDREEVLAALDAGRRGGTGPARLAVATLGAAHSRPGRFLGQPSADGPDRSPHRQLLS
ncbi:hypothetical protein ACWF94_31390, partial [Streptomyces sp. NPDC055078]